MAYVYKSPKYRKAKDGDIPCRECSHVRKPWSPGMRWRCYYGSDSAVGANHTCNKATTK